MTLKKSGQIYFSKSLRKELDFKIGDYIYVFMDGEQIVLTKREEYDKENKCTFNQNGTLHIPTEIRKLSGINSDIVLTIMVDEKKNRINLIPDSKV